MTSIGTETVTEQAGYQSVPSPQGTSSRCGPSSPSGLAGRRAEAEKHHREIGEFHRRETEQQQERINREERERHQI
jgi:hypothetical protein